MTNIDELPRHTVDYMWGGLDAEFRARLQSFVEASGGSVGLLSGYRSDEHQADLVADAQAKYGDDWRRWAAPPGQSNHNKGFAADLTFTSDAAQQWAAQNAERFGLNFPMGHEPWHIEPAGLHEGRIEGTTPSRDAYTHNPQMAHPMDRPTNNIVALDRLLRGPQSTIADAESSLGRLASTTAPEIPMESEFVEDTTPDLHREAAPIAELGDDDGSR